MLHTYSKAFDTVPHDTLIHKLSAYGVSGVLLAWLRNYFTDRFQVVRIIDTYSSPQDVKSGVIQGSTLGPALFTIFINDLDIHIQNSFAIKYADDVKVSISYPRNLDDELKATESLQEDLNNITSWSSRNGLVLNIEKCKIVRFGGHAVECTFLINNCPIEETASFKDLGILVSSPLNFNAYVQRIVLKALYYLLYYQEYFHFP